MCGIAGMVHPDPNYPRQEIEIRLAAMRDSLTHRGPDDAGFYLGPGVGLGSRRLAILDLSESGHMPMGTPDGRFWITYNGEIYNFRELRGWLEARGRTFRSHSDTEVLLCLYAEQGAKMLERLNGMFAFAIWDREEKTLFLARDRLGVKPLYYTLDENGFFCFASEEKAFFAAGVECRLDPGNWDELLCFRHIAGEGTPYQGIKRLLPGHSLIWKNAAIEIQCWWKLAERVKALRENLPPDPAGWFRETFDDAVKLRRISDVPVGVLLSSGLDSSSVAASLGRETGEGLASFTIAFEDANYDEAKAARSVAEKYGFRFHSLYVQPHELLELLLKATWFQDAPLAHASDAHLFALSRYAKDFVSVLLSGEGSDEILGGYVRYQPLKFPNLMNAVRRFNGALNFFSWLHPRIPKFARLFEWGSNKMAVKFNAGDLRPSDFSTREASGMSDFSYREQMLSEAEDLYPGDLFRQAMYYDQHTFLSSLLDRNDRMTMGASIECRTPFLDYRLVEILAAMPSRILLKGFKNKPLLRRTMNSRLPEVIKRQPKRGFGVPWAGYFRERSEFREKVEALGDCGLFQQGLLKPEKVQNFSRDFLRGDNTRTELIRHLLMLSLWHETRFNAASEAKQVLLNTAGVNG